MTAAQQAPFGSWRSPITSELIVAETVQLDQLALDGQEIYWSEMRPAEKGRSVIVRRSAGGQTADLTPAAWNARTRVHEYGGGAFTIWHGTVFFSNFADQRIYRQEFGTEPRPITPQGLCRYAEFVVDYRRDRLICVCEDHDPQASEPINTLVGLPLDGNGAAAVLVSGSDFCSSPRLSPDGSRLAWLAWNHPNMPWDGSELWVGQLDGGGTPRQAARVAGGQEESIVQPEWSPDGMLYFVSDRTGWWNLYRWRDGRVEVVCEMDAEFARPQWRLGMSSYAFESSQRIVACYTSRGTWNLASIQTANGKLKRIDTPYSDIRSLRASPGNAVFCGGSSTEPASIVRLDLDSGQIEVVRRSSQLSVDPGYISPAETIEFPTDNGRTAHGFFYPPRNKEFVAPTGERPPLLLISHGGPTSATSDTLSWPIQYWTSRGFAVLDVNYGGSTGYGRSYRQRLDGQWGVVDTDDCTAGARYLAGRGDVDPDRLAIRGSSAGGYTTLCALTFRDVFQAGASYYGVSDLEALTRETHKFESRYLDRLVAPYPDQIELYQARSPIHSADQISCPVILLQGLEDKVVPPNQAERLVERLRANGLPVAYVAFEGEQHGFRRAENIKRALDAELYFYSRVFGFALAEPVEPVEIANLPSGERSR